MLSKLFQLFLERIQISRMSSDEDKPPAPPVRLTSNRATDRGDSVASVDMRPLPKGMCNPKLESHMFNNSFIKQHEYLILVTMGKLHLLSILLPNIQRVGQLSNVVFIC